MLVRGSKAVYGGVHTKHTREKSLKSAQEEQESQREAANRDEFSLKGGPFATSKKSQSNDANPRDKHQRKYEAIRRRQVNASGSSSVKAWAGNEHQRLNKE